MAVAGARRALCLLALAHSLAAASAQAPKPLWDTGNKPRGLATKKKPDLSSLGAKKGKPTRKPSPGKPFGKTFGKPRSGKPFGKPSPGKPVGKPSPNQGPLKGKRPPGNPGEIPPDVLNKMRQEGTGKKSGKAFKGSHPRKPPKGKPPKSLPKAPMKNFMKPGPFDGKKAPASIAFVNEAPDAQDVDVFWVKSRKPHWPPLTSKRAGDAVRVRCRFGRRSGSTVQTAEELRSDLQVRGEFNITVRLDWAPTGSKHFLTLVKEGFFNGTGIFRAVKGLLAQFGVSHDSTLQQRFGSATIKDDRPRPWLLPLRRGTVAFAGSGAESRTSQLWVTLADGVAGEQSWETPIGYVQGQDGLDALDDINTEYGDLAMFNGSAPDPLLMAKEDGLDYLLKGWPNLDYFEGCAVEGDAEEELPGAPEEEEELVGTVEAGKQLTQQTRRGSTFISRLKGGSEVLQRTVVKETREIVTLSSAPVSEL